MIKIDRLCKTLGRSPTRPAFVLSVDVLAVEDGEILYCVGPNGSGKSTLLAVLTGALEPDSGSVEFLTASGPPIDYLALNPIERSSYFGYVAQVTMGQRPGLL